MAKMVAFFDVDQTLLAGHSPYYTAIRLIQHKVLRKRQLAHWLFYKMRSKILKADTEKLYKILISDMVGQPLDKILAIGKECFEKDIKPRMYQEGLRVIDDHKNKGHALYFMTSGPYLTIKAMGDYLGVNADYAPGPVIHNGILQSQMRKPIASGTGKLEIAKRVAELENSSLQDCYFYTDSIKDLILLEAVGHPHAVNPDSKLEQIARGRNWPISYFRQRLGARMG